LATIITIVTSASVAVIQILPVAVPPRWVPNSPETAGIGSRPRMLMVRTKKKTLQMYLMKRSVCGPSAGGAAATAHHQRHQRDQQHAGQGDHRDLVGEQRDLAVRRQRTEMGRPLDQRMLNDVLERALGVRRGRRFMCGRLYHSFPIASLTSSGSSTT
jgi:hypothetical protein